MHWLNSANGFDTEENTYILISGKCIRNKNEIKKFIEVTDYMGLIINEK